MVTKVEEIRSYLIASIQNGKLAPGDRLPSIRQLANQFSCNKDTVQRVLMELRFDNYIYAKPRSGYYVFDSHQEEVEEGVSLPNSEIANIAYDDFRLCLNETLIGREDYLFNYYYRQEGLLDLSKAVAKLMEETGVYVPLDDIVITAGTQQALFILTQVTFPNRKSRVLIEEPTYPRMIELIKTQNLPYETISRGTHGIDFQRLEEIFQTQSIKFFYVIPRMHNPLGTSYNPVEMKRLIEMAEKYDVYIVEDDYMSDFASQSPLHYYDTHGRVIYLKSFSRAIFPALRLAAICLPQALKSTFMAYKKLMDYDTNLILQKALALYIENGLYAKNSQYLKYRYQKDLANSKSILADHPNLPSYSLHHDSVLFDCSKLDNFKILRQYGDTLENYFCQKSHQSLLQVKNDSCLKQFLGSL
ncbi:TPA: PLP-dependent aminotransferase family protein [Streptococcus agalactiae]